jgi:Ankyrin repeats (3 copies)
LDELKALVQHYNVNLNLGDYDRCTPLYYATRSQNVTIVKYLVDEFGVNVNKKDRWGYRPIDYTQKGSDIEKILLAKGAIRS